MLFKKPITSLFALYNDGPCRAMTLSCLIVKNVGIIEKHYDNKYVRTF